MMPLESIFNDLSKRKEFVSPDQKDGESLSWRGGVAPKTHYSTACSLSYTPEKIRGFVHYLDVLVYNDERVEIVIEQSAESKRYFATLAVAYKNTQLERDFLHHIGGTLPIDLALNFLAGSWEPPERGSRRTKVQIELLALHEVYGFLVQYIERAPAVVKHGSDTNSAGNIPGKRRQKSRSKNSPAPPETSVDQYPQIGPILGHSTPEPPITFDDFD